MSINGSYVQLTSFAHMVTAKGEWPLDEPERHPYSSLYPSRNTADNEFFNPAQALEIIHTYQPKTPSTVADTILHYTKFKAGQGKIRAIALSGEA